MAGFNMDDYVDVAERVQEFYAKYPDGRLATVLVKFCQWPSDGIFAQAEAARTPDDPKPGVGSAWEPVPGKTQFTRDSEVQNAETAAWGRAIAAVGIKTKKIASADEVRARRPDQKPTTPVAPKGVISADQVTKLWTMAHGYKLSDDQVRVILAEKAGVDSTKLIPRGKFQAVLDEIEKTGTGVSA